MPRLILLLLIVWSVSFITHFGCILASKVYVRPNDTLACLGHPCINVSLLLDPDQSSEYLTSGNTLLFGAGTYYIETNWNTGYDYGGFVVIRNIHDMSIVGGIVANESDLETGSYASSETYADDISERYSFFFCMNAASFGFAFVNVTNLTISGLNISHCGANLTAKVMEEVNLNLNYVPPTPQWASFLFAHTFNLSYSRMFATGFLGMNLFGQTLVSNSVFVDGKQLFLIDFSDPTPNVMMRHLASATINITNSHFYRSKHHQYQYSHGPGLSLNSSQVRYIVEINIAGLVVENNMGSNVFFQVNKCSSTSVAIQNLISRNARGLQDGLGMSYELKDTGSCSSRKRRPNHAPFLHISDSIFADNLGEESPIGSPICAGLSVSLSCRQGVCPSAHLNAIIENVIVSNNSGTSLKISNILDNITFYNTTIINNTGTVLSICRSSVNFKDHTYISKNSFQSISEPFENSILRSNVTFLGHTELTKNTIEEGTVVAQFSNVVFNGNTTFMNNRGSYYTGAVYSYRSNIAFKGKTLFLSNHGRSGSGAIYASRESQVILYDQVNFTSNKGFEGGALSLHTDSLLRTKKDTTVTFVSNHAHRYGGGIFVDVGCNSLRERCFYDPDRKHQTRNNLTQVIVLENNTAEIAGSALFGGAINSCTLGIGIDGHAWFRKLFQFAESNDNNSLSMVSSDPVRVCICVDNQPACDQLQYNVTAYPGQSFYVPLVSVGQLNGTIPATVSAGFNSEQNGRSSVTQAVQQTYKYCSNLEYIIKSNKSHETLIIGVGPLSTFVVAAIRNHNGGCFNTPVHIQVILLPCELGFELQEGSCICNSHLQKYDLQCNIGSQTIYRLAPMWISAIKKGSQTQTVVHEHCPPNYCSPDDTEINLHNPDTQCQFNRVGVLCGKCQQNYSLILGGFNCWKCSNMWLLLVIAFIVAGFLFVILVMALNLTVSVGTLNGLVFYANIVEANGIFLSSNLPTGAKVILEVFIAWLNLDLGIKMCFFDGLDAYSKTWLQFLFPLYIWCLVIVIIVASHYSTIASKFCRRNAVSVLATLLLLSYTKLLGVVCMILSFTVLEFSDGSKEYVWLYDGNILYLSGKHIPLFLAAILVLLVSVPFTAALLSAQCLQRQSSRWWLRWYRKLLPFFDAYMGPYKVQHRYWTGLLLLLRAVLFVIFSANALGDPSVNLMAILISILCLAMLGWYIGGVYKKWWLNILEFSFLLNLGIFTTATLYIESQTKHHKSIVEALCIGTAFLTFLGILAYHIYHAVTSSSMWRTRINSITAFSRQQSTSTTTVSSSPATENKGIKVECKSIGSKVPTSLLTFTDDELREPVMEYCDDFD